MTDEIIEMTDEQRKAARKTFDDQVHAHLGTRLRRRRRLLDWTQQHLAEKLGIRFQQIQKYECAANAMNIPRLMQICETTGVHPEFFFAGLPIWDRITKNPKRPEDELSIEDIKLAQQIRALPSNRRITIINLIESFKDD